MISRGFIKGRGPVKFAQLISSSLLTFFHNKTKNAQLKTPTDLLHKNLMKPLDLHQLLAIYPNAPPLYRVVRLLQWFTGLISDREQYFLFRNKTQCPPPVLKYWHLDLYLYTISLTHSTCRPRLVNSKKTRK